MELINHNEFFSQQQHSHIHWPNNGGRNDVVAGGSRPQAVQEGNQNSFPCGVCGKKFSKIKAKNGHMRIHPKYRLQQPDSTRRPRTNVMEPRVNGRNIPDLNKLPDETDMMIMEPYQNVRNIPDLNKLPDETDMMIMEPYQNVRNIPDLNKLPDPEDDQI